MRKRVFFHEDLVVLPEDPRRGATLLSAMSAARLVLDLFKVRIGLMIGLTAMFGWVVGAGNVRLPGRALVLFGAMVVLSAAAGAYNQLVERDLDAAMQRTRRRPFVTGRLRAGRRWYALIALIASSGCLLARFAGNPECAVFAAAGFVTYAFVYTRWLKRRTPWNIVIGGLAGSFAVLAGAAAAQAGASAPVLAFALVLFLWTPPHFWSLALAYRTDYVAAGIPMMPAVLAERPAVRLIFASAVALVLAGLLPAALGLGRLYLACALALGAYFLRSSAALLRQPSRDRALANFRASLVYLALLMLAAVADVGLIGHD